MLPATCRMASSRPKMVFSLAMFSRKEVGNLFTLDWVVPRANRAGTVRIAVSPKAMAENRPMRSRSQKNFLIPPQRQIS